MEKKELINETTHLVQQDFEIVVADADFITEEQLEKALSEVIYNMIEHDLEKLFAILYRLDVSEQKVHAALRMGNDIPGHIAIAKLIIARQKEKALSRITYRQDKEDDEVSRW
jgi:hypothetical protein